MITITHTCKLLQNVMYVLRSQDVGEVHAHACMRITLPAVVSYTY